jgi:paraquat-inducible protein A
MPGALAFGGVVVLTMLAAMAFDPRLIWDAPEPAARPPLNPCPDTHV